MSDISVTAGSVLKYTGATTENGTAGETVTAGQLVYKNSSQSNKFYKAQHDGTSSEATLYGIALNGASDGQPLQVQTAGDVNPGGTVAVGTIYCVSATAGGIAPSADVSTGDYMSIFGVGTTSSKIHLHIYNSGVQGA